MVYCHKEYTHLNRQSVFGKILMIFGLLSYLLIGDVASAAVQQYLQSMQYNGLKKPIKPVITNLQKDVSTTKNKHKKRPLKAASEDFSLWSNAFNFHNAWGTQVNPRTGTLSAYVKVGSLVSNWGRGPDIALNVNYNSNSKADPDGLGMGWSWNLTHFNPHNNQLSTSQGEDFNLQQMHNGRWWPLYHKLHDIQIDGSKEKNLVITYTNGLREILDHNGYEVRLEQQDGRGVNFYYTFGSHNLTTISDDQGHKITLNRHVNYLTVTSSDSDGKPVDIRLNKFDGELRAITLPDNISAGPGIHFNYHNFLLEKISYPTGLQKHISYNCNDAMQVILKNNRQVAALCAVVRLTVDPGAKQPKSVIHYSYGQTSGNHHNYLAFNSGLTVLPNTMQDALFEASGNYTYKTTEDNGLVKKIRTYNKYHLLTDTKIISDHTGALLSEIQDFFCRTDQADGCAETNFNDLPATYSLPLKIITKNWGSGSGAPSVDIVSRTYDNRGRVISSTDAYGCREKISYCPVAGDSACPAEPAGWSLSSQLKSVTEYPAAKSILTSEPLPVMTNNFYSRELNITGHGYILKLKKIIVQSGNLRITTKRHYYNDINDPFLYGLLRQQTLTGTISPGDQLNLVTKNYYYKLNTEHSTKTSYTSIVINNNKLQYSPSQTISLFTNQVITRANAEGKNISRYHYDHWGRLIRMDTATDTPFATSSYYKYTVSPQLNQVLITTANHLQQKIIFDGAGNKLSSFITAISVTGKAKTDIFLPEQRVTYDRYGRIITKSRYTFDQSVKMDMLTTKFSYDDMGRIIHTHLPDGQIIVRKYDDPDRCSVNYSEDSQGHRSVVSVTRTNILDSPKTQITLPASTVSSLPIKQICTEGEKLSSARVTRIMYDSFGRAVQVIAPNGNRIRKYYDREGRVTDFIDPAKNTTHYVYNLIGKVIATWLLPAKSNQRYLMFSAQYNAAGEPVWKAGESGKRIFYTYTSTGKISTIITPHHDIIAWKYNSVNLPVSESVNGKEISQVQYDLVTRQPINKKDITGTTHYNYSDDERMQELIHFSKNNYPNYYLHWQYNNNRQTVNVTDIAGNSIQTQYDRFGRINTTYYQPKHKDSHLLSALSYDGLSRIMAIKYGSGMQRTLHYNGYGQQDEMTDTLAGKLLSQWQYQYDNTDNISTLRQNAGINQQAVLHYQYDNLDNLTTMTCSGSAGLPLCPRDTAFEQSSLDQAPVITRQKYYFNALNRIISVKETLKDAVLNHTLSKVTAYHYDNLKSLQRLQQINTQWNNNQLKLYNFSYDDSGNMIVDGSGNHLTYNSFNQVTKVISTQGKQSSYAYDGSGREAREITSAGDTHYLLYTGKSLFGEIVNNLHNEKKIIGYMGSANTLNGSVYRYYEKNYKGDVTGVLTKINGHYILHQRDIYSPYGMVWHSKPVADLPAYEQSLQGFNGERTDPETGWYFLGAGHRVYNPQQRYFVSADPCGDGYAFGSNNPVMNTDPSGNKPVSLKKFLNGLSYVNTLGLKAAHNKWATAAGIIVMTGLMVFSAIGISKYFGASAKLATMMSIPAFISGFFSFLSAVIPNNKGLNITSTIVGTAVAAVTLAAAGVGIFRAAVNACTVTEASGSILSDELASISDEEGETVSLIKQSDIQNIDNMQYSVLKDVASDDLSEDVVSVETDEQLNAIWQSQSKYSQQMPEYLKNDLVGLLGIARETTKKISMNDLVELIVADADRSLEAKTRYTETFNKILSSFVSNFEYIEDSDFGYDLEERMTPGMKGIAMTPKKSDNSRFVGYITREDDREDGRSIWGTYLLYKDKSIKFTVDSFEWLGLDQFFTGGYFFVKNFREL